MSQRSNTIDYTSQKKTRYKCNLQVCINHRTGAFRVIVENFPIQGLEVNVLTSYHWGKPRSPC